MSQTLHFSVHGDFITDKIRDFIYEGNVNKAWELFSCMSQDKDLFKLIAKGLKAFDGVNTFTLINTRKDDVGYEAFSRLLTQLSSLKKEQEQLEDTFENHKSQIEMSLKELISFQKDLTDDIEKCEKEIATFREMMNYSDEDVKLALLFKHTSKDMSSLYGWITEKGWFIPVPFHGHDGFIYEYNEAVKDNLTVAQLEKKWIRITQSARSILISMLGFKPTAKQEQTLYKWLNHHKPTFENGYLISVNSYFGARIVIENNQYRLIKKDEE